MFFFRERHVRQPTLIQDASRAPRSDVAALRRKGISTFSRKTMDFTILTRLAEAELLTIAETTVQRISQPEGPASGFSTKKRDFLYQDTLSSFFMPLG